MSVLIRLGKTLLVAEHADGGFTIQGKLDGDALIPTVPTVVPVAERFIINPAFEVEDGSLGEATRLTFRDLVQEAVKPFVTSGRACQVEGSTLAAYQPHGQGLGFLTEGSVSWLGLDKILTHESLGQLMALEGVRDRLEDVGVLSHRAPMIESSRVLTSPVNVYMKVGVSAEHGVPVRTFRDITTLREGLDVAVVGYLNGCAVLEADGEEFWLPCEERHSYQPAVKDAWYYFNQDSDDDKIQDPLQALPSKAALNTGFPAEPADNWNASAELRTQAGHFAPMPNIKMEKHGAGIFESVPAASDDKSKFQAYQFRVGDSWESPEGTKKIASVQDGKAQVEVVGRSSSIRELIPMSSLWMDVYRDVKNAASRASAKQFRNSQQAKADKAVSLFGFETSLSPTARGQAVISLNKSRKSDGRIIKLKDLVAQKVRQGYKVQGDRLINPKTGSFLNKTQIGAYGIGLAQWLVAHPGVKTEGASHDFEDFERLGRPLIHDRSAVPGLDPTDEEEAIDDHMDDIEALTKASDADPADVPQDYAGEEGDEHLDDGTMQEVVDRLVQGADIDTILDATTRRSRPSSD